MAAHSSIDDGSNVALAESATIIPFDDMGLDSDLIRGIYSYGFEQPSRIQSLAIPPMKMHTDILAQSQSGTGKTGAFVIGSLSVLDKIYRTSFFNI